VKANGTDKPERVKVRAPTLANLPSVSTMLKDNNLADVPITIAAIDPCFSCTDRMIRVKGGSKKKNEVLSWESLRLFSIGWYLERGIDFGSLNKTMKKLDRK